MNLRTSWLPPTGQTREDTRLTQFGAATPTDALRSRSGILPGSDDGTSRLSGFALENTSAMTATVHEGRALIQGLQVQGAYPVTLAEPATLTFDDGDAQFGRIDLVVIRVHDDQYDSSGLSQATVEIVKGTATATPTPPAVPDLALPLHQVTVPAGVSAGTGGIPWSTAVTDLRTTTVAAGGILPGYGPTAAGAYPGQYQDSGGWLQRWDGGTWVPYPRALGGIAPAGELSTASYTGQYRDGANGTLERWDGAAWQPVLPGPVIKYTADAAYTTSTTYVENPPDSVAIPMVVSFTAPPSGKVLVSLGSGCSPRVDNATAWLSVRIRQSGVSFQEPSDDYSARNNAQGNIGYVSVSTKFPVTGLTPGSPCTATLCFRTTNSTTQAWFDTFYLCVEPLR